MLKVGAYEAKTRLSELLNMVARGERVVITRHGVPVAALEQVAGETQPDPRGAVEALKQFGRGRKLDGDIKELIEEGRT